MLDRTNLQPMRTAPVDWDALFREAEIPKQKCRLFFSGLWREWVIEPQGPDYRGAVVIAVTPPPLAAGEVEVRLRKGVWTFFGFPPEPPEQAELFEHDARRN